MDGSGAGGGSAVVEEVEAKVVEMEVVMETEVVLEVIEVVVEMEAGMMEVMPAKMEMRIGVVVETGPWGRGWRGWW